MRLSWKTITVQQFQQVYEISKDPALDEMDRAEKLVCILHNKTIHMINEMSIARFRNLAAKCYFALDIDTLPGKQVRTLKANGKRYGINYSISKMKHRQYVESVHFGEKPIENMHQIMASIVQPINFFGKWGKNDADNHKDIASDLLQARLIDVYHSCVFFCKLYLNLINSIKPFLIQELIKKGVPEQEASGVLTISQSISAGCIAHEKWQPWKVYQ